MRPLRAQPHARLDLQSFIPFRLNRLAAEFSSALLADYGARFGLDIPEWRVLATLGACDVPLSAAVIVRSTRTHKSRISRAVANLTALGHLRSVASGDDRRAVDLQLTPQGRALYEALVPRMLAREAELLAELVPGDRAALSGLLSKLERGVGIVAERE